MTRPSFVDPGWTMAVAAFNRSDIRVLFYPSGERRFWHTCTIPNVVEDIGTIECSPLLNHEITIAYGPDVQVTVSPSIHCLRCHLHGFFEKNVWRDA